jgi:putative tricarboxylic transport membrane protein
MDTVSAAAADLRLDVLLRGFDFLIAVIGLFGIGEILLTMEEGLAFKRQARARSTRQGGAQDLARLPRYWVDAAALLA